MADKRASSGDDLKLNMTSLMDVTFLILIFLMVLPFKTLERKVAAFLPKDRGLAKTMVKIKQEPKISVVLKRTRTQPHTEVQFMDQVIGQDHQGLQLLRKKIATAAESATTPEAKKKLKGEINAWPWVPHQDVITAVDAFMAAGVRNITFVGTAPKGQQTLGNTDPNDR